MMEERAGTCKIPEWKGDGVCDDENNCGSCDWDGGDCCGNYALCSDLLHRVCIKSAEQYFCSYSLLSDASRYR